MERRSNYLNVVRAFDFRPVNTRWFHRDFQDGLVAVVFFRHNDDRIESGRALASEETKDAVTSAFAAKRLDRRTFATLTFLWKTVQ